MNGISLLLSLLTLLSVLWGLRLAYRTVKTIERRNPPHTIARHASPRQRPRTPAQTPWTRERIPLQVEPEVEAANAHIIEAYAEDADDLLMRPFVNGYPAGDDTVVIAVP